MFLLLCIERLKLRNRGRSHAREHGHTDREVLYDSLVNRATEESA